MGSLTSTNETVVSAQEDTGEPVSQTATAPATELDDRRPVAFAAPAGRAASAGAPADRCCRWPARRAPGWSVPAPLRHRRRACPRAATDRASRSRAATTFGEGESAWSMPSSVMTMIVVRDASPASGGRARTQWRRGSVIETSVGRQEVAGLARQGHEVGVILTSPAGGCSSAAASVVLDDGTVQVVPKHRFWLVSSFSASLRRDPHRLGRWPSWPRPSAASPAVRPRTTDHRPATGEGVSLRGSRVVSQIEWRTR